MSRRFIPVIIVFLWGIVGIVVGWFIGTLLVPDAFFGGIMGLVTAPCGMWLGLIVGAVVARQLDTED